MSEVFEVSGAGRLPDKRWTRPRSCYTRWLERSCTKQASWAMGALG